MRLIHTSDWHLGRRLKGVDRTPEIEYQLEELLLAIKILKVDAVLVAGDIFDGPSPPAEAEKVAYSFFSQLRELDIPAVIIAGNHDSALRIDGIANLLSHLGIFALGRPKLAHQGGVLQIETKHGPLCVAALPFASERRLLKFDDLWEKNELEQRQHYQSLMAQLFQNLASGFQEESVNVVMAHVTVEGAKLAHSEVDYYTRDIYSLPGQMLPTKAQYIALGHIHKPQQIPNSVPTYYSGSLIQVDFGEVDEEKGFNLITVEPNQPAFVEFKPLSCPKPLKIIRCDETHLEETLAKYQEHPGFLKAIVELNEPKLGLADQVRKVCPQALMVEAKWLETDKTAVTEAAEAYEPFDPVETFRRYWEEQVGTELSASLLQTYEELYYELNNELSHS